jgi:hypothetical protein
MRRVRSKILWANILVVRSRTVPLFSKRTSLRLRIVVAVEGNRILLHQRKRSRADEVPDMNLLSKWTIYRMRILNRCMIQHAMRDLMVAADDVVQDLTRNVDLKVDGTKVVGVVGIGFMTMFRRRSGRKLMPPCSRRIGMNRRIVVVVVTSGLMNEKNRNAQGSQP